MTEMSRFERLAVVEYHPLQLVREILVHVSVSQVIPTHPMDAGHRNVSRPSDWHDTTYNVQMIKTSTISLRYIPEILKGSAGGV